MILKSHEISEIVIKALTKVKVKDNIAGIVADAALQADLRGIGSHGIKMIPTYIERIKKGGIDPNAAIEIVQKNDSVYIIDCKGGFGQVAAKAAQDIITKGIGENKSVSVGIKNANHCGMLAYYTENICSNYAVAFMTSNTNPNTAPLGGAEKILGTNPFSVAFPGVHHNIVIDMATTAVAKGKIYEYQLNNKPIPQGWAINSQGQSTTNPEEALKGILLPFGGHKGYAISIIIELLSGVMTGSGFLTGVHSLHKDLDLKQNVGIFIAGIPLNNFMNESEYRNKISEFISI
ncbi:MAG: Ldh family oxidoreductase [Clostridia bacterium]|nr:Ldh family oxidoreductase [Clostridia bacterium]